ncbi:hematopoietic lineage cell-specific protein-like isoform X3 [Cervus elaphus]|uniref:hematopoietic lineage cell-specific protein-like isoform X3 n=1 Tax=Cervus elaphus TaxID=9860 RepID=UPI001CC32C83|nr:hematopoietic lineage cell-specific protein-like isoform X3 [Cervus elaphus]
MVFCVRLLHLAQKLSPVPGNSSWITAFSAEFCERLTSAPGEERFVHGLSWRLSQRCSSRCGKPRPSTLCPSPRTTGEPTPGRTAPDFVNDVSEKEQRWGAKAVPLSGHQEHINIHKLRENVFQEHKTLREKELEMGPKASHSYGRKFGVEQDRMDKSAVGLEYQSKLSKCCLQVDSIWGFGGKFGVQLARVDQLFCSRWLFTRTWEAPRDTQGRTLSAGRFTGHRGHRLGTSPTLGLRAGGDTPQRPPDRLLTPAADRTPWLTQPSHQGRSQN